MTMTRYKLFAFGAVLLGFMISPTTMAESTRLGCANGLDQIKARVTSLKAEPGSREGAFSAELRFREPMQKAFTTKTFPICEQMRDSTNYPAFLSMLTLSKDMHPDKTIGLCLGPKPCIYSLRN